ncbi:MAG: hypothetical protein Q7S18_01165 [bacterium]|nr:hypothetical protein [bacterium]
MEKIGENNNLIKPVSPIEKIEIIKLKKESAKDIIEKKRTKEMTKEIKEKEKKKEENIGTNIDIEV